MGFAAAALVAAVGLLGSCAAAPISGQQGAEGPMQRRTIEEVLRAHTDYLMSIPGVVGTAQGLCAGKPCIKVFVAKKTPELLRKVPAAADGYPVAVEETGEFHPFPR
jgi:hypothetical protein